MELNTMWEATFPERQRPKLYTSDDHNDDGFLPLSEPSAFLMDNISGLSSAQLYALSANNVVALELAQREWLSLENLASRIKSRDPTSQPARDPQALSSHLLFDERKEATLYGYKYEQNRRMIPARFTISENVTDQEKFDCREAPEPFSQGGFIPTDKQSRAIMATAKAQNRESNPDDWPRYEENFALEPRQKGFWIPKILPREEPPPYKASTKNGEHKPGLIEGGESRRTRFNGERIPPTRGQSPARNQLLGNVTPRGKRSGTPIGSEPGTPQMKKRKLAAEMNELIPKPKHPNQYTKRREAEAAAAAAAAASTNGTPTSSIASDNPQIAQQPPKPKHPNQYTKRREMALMEGLLKPEPYRANSNSSSNGVTTQVLTPYIHGVSNSSQRSRTPNQPVDFNNISAAEKRAYNFKDDDLVAAVKQDHLWLVDDPVLALQWKDKILSAEFPVRTLAMLKKWHEWKKENRHKRPRKTKVQEGDVKENGVPNGEGKGSVKRRPGVRRALEGASESPAPMSPLAKSINADDITEGTDELVPKTKEESPQESIVLAEPRRALQYMGTEDELQASTTGTPDENGNGLDDVEDDNENTIRVSSQTSQDSDETYVYRNGNINYISKNTAEMMQRTRSQPSSQETVTVYDSRGASPRKARASPLNSSAANSRRSLRLGRRGST